MALIAPYGLTASNVSSSRIDLSWSNGEYYDTILIYRKVAGGSYASLDTVTGTDTSYSDTSCSANTNYYYKIAGTTVTPDSSGFSNESGAWTNPTAPSGLSATATSTSNINLSWTNNSTYSYLFIERGTDGVSYAQIAAPSGSATSYSDPSCASNTKYYYQIKGNNTTSGLYSSYSTAANATTQAAAPSGLDAAVVAGETGEGRIDLSWSNNDTYNSIKVERSTGGAYSQIDSITGTDTTYSSTGLTSATTYYYRIRGYTTAYGNTDYSNVDYDSTRPDQPSSLSATAVSPSQINLAWTNNDSYSSVVVQRKPSGGTFAIIATLAGSATSYNNTTGLSAGTAYTYEVYATYAGHTSVGSNEASATTGSAYTKSFSDSISLGESLTDVATSQSTFTGSISLGETFTGSVGYSGTFSDSISLGDLYSDAVVLDVDIGYYLGSDDGKLYQFHSDYTADASSNITTVFRTKQIDFTDQYPQYANKRKTIYKIRMWYQDLYADTYFTVSVSTDGGATWLNHQKLIGAGSEYAKSSDFYFIKSGDYFDIKIEHGSAVSQFQLLGLEIYFEPSGTMFEVS